MTARYVHGYDAGEMQRLQDQARTLEGLLHADTTYPAGARVLEAGCGVGAQTVPLTHEELASMLGVGRSYASRVIQTFKADGVLDTRRGALVVRDRAALEARSCRCNESVKDHFREVLSGVYPEDDT